jgi:hypothetical protein
LMAVPVGLIWLFAPMIGAGWSTLVVSTVGLLMAMLLFKLGTRRVKAVLKRPEDR